MQAMKPVTKPSKQRKILYQAPDHRRYKLMSATLSQELKGTHGTNALPVRSGDTVRIMRGDHKGFEGKITSVDRSKFRVYVEGLTREKVDGTTVFVPVHPSKVMLTSLTLDDRWRKKILERKKEAHREIEEKAVAEKPIEEKVVPEKVPKPAPAKEKPSEEKPKRRRRKVTKKPTVKKAKEKVEEITEEEAPKKKKPRAKRKVTKKVEGES